MVGREDYQHFPYHISPSYADMVCTPDKRVCAAARPVVAAAEQTASRWIHWNSQHVVDIEKLWSPSQELRA
jgi:hypothetical protein